MNNFKTWLEEISFNPLDGLNNNAARKKIYQILTGVADGIFRDDSWEGVKKIWKTLDENKIHWTLVDSEYGVSPNFAQSFPGPKWRIPNDFKQWKFEIKFINNNQRETILHGRIVASGAGSMEDPLEKYDITVMVD